MYRPSPVNQLVTLIYFLKSFANKRLCYLSFKGVVSEWMEEIHLDNTDIIPHIALDRSLPSTLCAGSRPTAGHSEHHRPGRRTASSHGPPSAASPPPILFIPPTSPTIGQYSKSTKSNDAFLL